MGLALPCSVYAQASFAGTYRAAPSEHVAKVSTWGEDCGPRPQSHTGPARPSVEVRLQGTHLALTFTDRAVRTDACWSPNPMVRVTNTTATAGRWRTECRTPDGEAKQERGVYTAMASSSTTIDLVEESAYDWQLNESHCVATMRITQRLSRADVAEETEAEPEAAISTCTPGALARLRLRPSAAKIGPGERVCFSVRGFDAAGCAVPLDPAALAWTLIKPGAASGTLSGGCFKAAPRAAEAEGRFQVAVASGALRAEGSVSVASADLSDITARRGGPSDERTEDDEDDGIASALGIQAAVKRAPLGATLIAATLLLGLGAGLGWILLRRRRALGPLVDEGAHTYVTHSDLGAPKPSPLSPTPSTPSAPGESLICPLCRRGYLASVPRCPKDGGVPIPYAEFLRQAQAPSGQPRTCPACGAQLAPGALFCGKCGGKVGA